MSISIGTAAPGAHFQCRPQILLGIGQRLVGARSNADNYHTVVVQHELRRLCIPHQGDDNPPARVLEG